MATELNINNVDCMEDLLIKVQKYINSEENEKEKISNIDKRVYQAPKQKFKKFEKGESS